MDSLDPTTVILGVSCIAYFVVWLLGRRVESLEDAFDSLPAAGVAFAALLATPFFIYYAWQQIGAKSRLAAEHLLVSRALGHAVGAQGGRAPRCVWRFEAHGEPRVILASYETNASATGWKIEHRKDMLVLSNAEAKFAIWIEKHGDEQQIVFEKKLAPPSAAVKR